MSTTHETPEISEPETKNQGKSFSIYPPSENRFIEQMKKSTSKYRQTIENYQQDWARSYQNYFQLVESLQHDFAEKSDTTVSMIDANTKIVRALNENAKAFAELNQTISQIWYSSWSPQGD